MLEPLTAISLASAIIQFVDFGSKILSSGYETYLSTHGATEDNVDLESLTQSLYKFHDQLSTPLKQPTQNDRELQNLAQKCSNLAGDLLVLLDSFKVKDHGLIRTWDALRQSCRLVWKKDEIAKKELMLNSITGQVNSRLLYMIRQDTSSLSPQIQRLEAKCDQLSVDLEAEIRSAQNSLLAKLDEQSLSLKAIEGQQAHQQKVENVEGRRTYYTSLQNVPIQINNFVQSIGKVAKDYRVLRSLLVAGLGSREEQIHNAYEKTFDWIFKDEELRLAHKDRERIKAVRTRFERWLSSSSEVFWVNGKAGSGKSTLMKYLADNHKTQEILGQWAGGENLVIAKHFFWNSGSKIQKTHVGLMQDLLLQILRKCSELRPFASPERWEADEDALIHKDSWTRAELAASLKNVMLRGQLQSRFCFFIDGLDEYADENVGEHHELIEYLDTLAQSTQVKLCVSSRPWTVFKDRYEGREDLTLILQDLTSNDMYTYVDGMLNKAERFRRLVVREPQALDLAYQIRDKAEGVFLWVYLVVRSLLKGLSEHDDTVELERRLSKIPKDLNEFFLKIFQNIEPVYRPEASRAFQLSAVSMPLPLLAFKHISKEVRSPRYAFEMTAAQLTVSDEKAEDNVNKWCRDLLEIKTGGGNDRKRDEVYFLHRTVKDFLLTREMQAYLMQYPVCQSSPKQAICMVLFAEIKAMGTCQSASEHRAFLSNSKKLMDWALECEKTEGQTPTEILDEFGCVRRPVMTAWQGSHADHKSRAMLHYALETGLCLYVRQCLDRGPKAEDGTCTLGLFSPFNRTTSHHIAANDQLAFFVLLLEKGADPNQLYPSGRTGTSKRSRETMWETFLAAFYDDKIRTSVAYLSNEDMRPFAKPWILYGADIDIKVTIDRRRCDVRTCLLTKNGHWPGMTRTECEKEVDGWLADARARPASVVLAKPSRSSKRASLRVRIKRLLA